MSWGGGGARAGCVSHWVSGRAQPVSSAAAPPCGAGRGLCSCRLAAHRAPGRCLRRPSGSLHEVTGLFFVVLLLLKDFSEILITICSIVILQN